MPRNPEKGFVMIFRVGVTKRAINEMSTRTDPLLCDGAQAPFSDRTLTTRQNEGNCIFITQRSYSPHNFLSLVSL